MNIYLAGPIFTERDRNFNSLIEQQILAKHPEVNLYLAQNNKSINDKSGCATSADIYAGDIKRLKESDLVITIMSGDMPPIGSSYECAFYSALCANDINKKIIALYDDSREGSKTYSEAKTQSMLSGVGENQWPYINLLAIGFIKKCGEVYTNSRDFIQAIINQIELFEDPRTSGIYKITNLKNNLMYIGQTHDFRKRWLTHWSHCEHIKDRHDQNELYKDMEEIGLEYFKFEILEKCDSSKLDEREEYWINYYDALNVGYNRTSGGQNSRINIQTQQTVKVYAYNLDGTFAKEYVSIASAMRACGLKTNNITRNIKWNDNHHITGGYMWRLFKVEQIPPFEKKKTTRMIYSYDVNTRQFVAAYENMAEASKKLFNSTRSHIGDCLTGKRLSCGGFLWATEYHDILPLDYIEHSYCYSQPVYCYDLNTGNFQKEYPNASQAAKELGIVNHIPDVINGFRHQCGGYLWSLEKKNNIQETIIKEKSHEF